MCDDCVVFEGNAPVHFAALPPPPPPRGEMLREGLQATAGWLQEMMWVRCKRRRAQAFLAASTSAQARLFAWY